MAQIGIPKRITETGTLEPKRITGSGSPVSREEEVKDLCVRVLPAKAPESFDRAFSELAMSICEHMEDAENLLIRLILKSPKVKAVKGGTEG